ncbi:MAG: hypothetical protein JSS49_30050 [Planctomycetes bacterium]|nr:hypothetical protein [Planctomycetota bacterium]
MISGLLYDCQPGCTAETASRRQVLQKWEQTASTLSRVKLHGVIQINADYADGHNEGKIEVAINRDHSNWRVTQESSGTQQLNGEPVPYGGIVERIFGETYLDLHVIQVGNGSELPYEKRLNIDARIEDVANAAKIHAYLRSLNVLFGYAAATEGQFYWHLLQKENADEELATELIEGHETVVISSHGDYGKHTVWLDPACGALPRRIVIEKQAGDLSYKNRRLGGGDGEKAAPSKRKRRQQSVTESLTLEYDKFALETRGDAFVISGFQFTSRKKSTGRDDALVELESIQLDRIDIPTAPLPASDFAPTIAIPERTAVLVSNAPAIKYEWRNGELQKTIPVDADALRKAKFAPPQTSRYLLVAFNSVIAVVIIVAWLYRRQREKQKPTPPK